MKKGSSSGPINALLQEVKSLPAALRELDRLYLAIVVAASFCAIVAKMVSDHVRDKKLFTAFWEQTLHMTPAGTDRVDWALFYVLGYFVIPLFLVRVVFRQSPRDFGLGLGHLKQHLPIYGLLTLLAIPMVWYASTTDVFLSKYPKMPAINLREFVILEALYALQFLGVEFFYRGFILFPSVRKFGLNGILIPIIPYAMLHFGKPIPEAIASIFAGLLLGYYAWKSRSIWGGVFLHVMVAVGMDSLAHIQKGSLF